MKTTRWLVVGALLVGGPSTVAGCGGGGTYQIPNVAPVVKQKPADDDLLDDSAAKGSSGGESTPSSTGSESPKSDDVKK